LASFSKIALAPLRLVLEPHTARKNRPSQM
jgi:hypothetical protein